MKLSTYKNLIVNLGLNSKVFFREELMSWKTDQACIVSYRLEIIPGCRASTFEPPRRVHWTRYSRRRFTRIRHVTLYVSYVQRCLAISNAELPQLMNRGQVPSQRNLSNQKKRLYLPLPNGLSGSLLLFPQTMESPTILIKHKTQVKNDFSRKEGTLS